LEQGKFLLNRRKYFTMQMVKYLNGQISKQVANRGCGISIMGYDQNSSGECPEQPDPLSLL